jgi:hypothetical protein
VRRSLYLLALVSLVLLAGCGSALADSVRTLNATRVLLVEGRDALVDSHKRASEEIVAEAPSRPAAEQSLEGLNAIYRRAYRELRRARLAWNVAAAAAGGAEVAERAGRDPDDKVLLDAMVALAGAFTAFQAASRSLLEAEVAR